MERTELETYKSKLQYSLSQLELDYYQHRILGKLFEQFNTIYFKGGTALQKCYGIKRFSEDLDFNYTNLDIQEVINFVENEYNTTAFDINTTRFGISFSIKIEGMLFTGDPRTYCKIVFDFRENDVYTDPLKKVIRPIYADLNNYLIIALSEEEILAEKIRAILTRYKARDIYDLHELLLNGVDINFELVQKKLRTYNKVFDQKEFEKKIEEKRSIYEQEMNKLTRLYPSFDECKKTILEKISHKPQP